MGSMSQVALMKKEGGAMSGSSHTKVHLTKQHALAASA
jgi:hypothetical protein